MNGGEKTKGHRRKNKRLETKMGSQKMMQKRQDKIDTKIERGTER